MIKRILIIGGYGNFGRFISEQLALERNIQIIIAGRSTEKSQHLATTITAVNLPETAVFDINDNINEKLKYINPDIVIHTSGPFQSQGYAVANACVNQGCHYIDLADGRDFVENIITLNNAAISKGVLVISGASSVPCLTSALVEYYKGEFQTLESLNYGITTAQQTARGLATTAAILGYTGKAFTTTVDGKPKTIYGWQGLHLKKYKNLGWRFLGNCDVPDLSLFPKLYPSLKNIRFYAGLEIPLIHITLYALSWFVRLRLIRNLQNAAPLLLRLSFLFDHFGTSNSGFHMELAGKDHTGGVKTIDFELVARKGDGPYIPCMPAIIMAKKIVDKKLSTTGAYPCVGFISRDEYLNALAHMDIDWECRT